MCQSNEALHLGTVGDGATSHHCPLRRWDLCGRGCRLGRLAIANKLSFAVSRMLVLYGSRWQSDSNSIWGGNKLVEFDMGRKQVGRIGMIRIRRGCCTMHKGSHWLAPMCFFDADGDQTKLVVELIMATQVEDCGAELQAAVYSLSYGIWRCCVIMLSTSPLSSKRRWSVEDKATTVKSIFRLWFLHWARCSTLFCVVDENHRRSHEVMAQQSMKHHHEGSTDRVQSNGLKRQRWCNGGVGITPSRHRMSYEGRE